MYIVSVYTKTDFFENSWTETYIKRVKAMSIYVRNNVIHVLTSISDTDVTVGPGVVLLGSVLRHI